MYLPGFYDDITLLFAGICIPGFTDLLSIAKKKASPERKPISNQGKII